MRHGSNFSNGKASKKPIGANMKIQRNEVTNKNLIQKHRIG